MGAHGRGSEPFRHRVTPRYLEVDRQGIVFNMWYLGLFDDAMSAFLAHRGLPYPALLELGYDVSLVHTEIDWERGLRFGEVADIEVRVERLGRTSFTLRFDVVRDDQRLSRGRTVYVVVADDGSGKREIPQELRSCLDGDASD